MEEVVEAKAVEAMMMQYLQLLVLEGSGEEAAKAETHLLQNLCPH